VKGWTGTPRHPSPLFLSARTQLRLNRTASACTRIFIIIITNRRPSMWQCARSCTEKHHKSVHIRRGNEGEARRRAVALRAARRAPRARRALSSSRPTTPRRRRGCACPTPRAPPRRGARPRNSRATRRWGRRGATGWTSGSLRRPRSETTGSGGRRGRSGRPRRLRARGRVEQTKDGQGSEKRVSASHPHELPTPSNHPMTTKTQAHAATRRPAHRSGGRPSRRSGPWAACSASPR
jgi:hypothetical protein